MQKIPTISLILCLGIAISATAGDLRITCPPGLDIFVDEEFVGASTAPEDGKYLDGLSDGYHVIRIEKEGFLPKWFSANIGSKIQVLEVQELTPKPEAEQKAARRSGSVRVSTSSENSTVKFGGQKTELGVNAIIFGNVLVGLHDIWFDRFGVVLHEKIVIHEGETTEAMGNFFDNRIDILADAVDDETVPATVEVAETKTKSDCFHYWIQVAQSSDVETIKAFQEQLEEKEIPPYHQRVLLHEDGAAIPLYKLRVGPMANKGDAKLMTRKVTQAGFRNTWLVREECD
jgi:hypothetical protein